ncbi:MAG TPA: YjbE family putative metal transport protein [Ktedonobacterales bacterium]|nr:YjbE family putative metal transport protein [Ktedonobacterales bacterium]
MLEVLGIIGSIVLVDLVLSGDNALVIGAAAASLPRQQRYTAILAGGIGAIVLRILFTLAAALLLQLPLLQAIGGILLIAIAAKLLHDRERDLKKHAAASEAAPETEDAASASDRSGGVNQGVQRGFVSALLTIIVADVTMSLDNVLAVAALASEHIPLLIGGLLLSILILLVGSALVAELINRLPWLLDVAALVLGWTAANMILHDRRLGPILEQQSWTALVIPGVILGVILAVDIVFRLRRKPATQRAIAAPHD